MEMNRPFIILPEEQAPEGIEHCELCELSKRRTRVIWGEGNPRASLMMILDNPEPGRISKEIHFYAVREKHFSLV